MSPAPTIVWFYHDLRLSDNIALTRAAAEGPVVPVYIHDDTYGEGAASKWWLQTALQNLAQEFTKRKITLLFKRGKPLDILRMLIKATGATSVIWARRYEPKLAARDKNIVDTLQADGIKVVVEPGFLLFEPALIYSNAGTPFKVYTPFAKACFAAPAPTPSLPEPDKMSGVNNLMSDALEEWHLVPKTAQWPAGLRAAWPVSEAAAAQTLHDFVTRALVQYKDMRNRPDIPGTSRLSPYLHFGQISPRQVWQTIRKAQAQNSGLESGGQHYLQELLWREFSWHLLYHITDFTTAPLQKSFNAFPWREDASGLRAWQSGLTGYPIVDAGMRELWQTGWMHNRVRMIAGSFLIKDLLIDWRDGMAWFWDTLVDADLGSNTASWQWVAGCGADAAPYFRIFNPVLQGLKFDPEGKYVRRFIPELAKLDAPFIHEPWTASTDQLAEAGIILGKTYPRPIIDHARARQRALQALKISKGATFTPLGEATSGADLFD